MEERKNTHIAGICKFKYKETKDKYKLLILFPIEISDGILLDNKNFIDHTGTEYLPALDAFRKGLKFGYILDVPFQDIITKGKQALIDEYCFNKDDSALSTPETTIASYKSHYAMEFREMVWYYDFGCIPPHLEERDIDEFKEAYGLLVDPESGMVHDIKEEDNEDELDEDELEEHREKKEEIEEENKNKGPYIITKIKPAITRKELIAETKKFVYAQDEAIEQIASELYSPYKLDFDLEYLGGNILIYGPPGSGKTLMIKTIARLMGLPYFYKSLADFSASGYEGKSVNSLLLGLYNSAGRNMERLERGAILLMDEVDKLPLGGKADVKTQVYNELLEICQPGGTVSIQTSEYGEIQYHKENLRIISGGSFAGMKEKTIGFGAEKSKDVKRLYTIEEFAKFGIPREFIGRHPVQVPIEALTEDDLYRILATALSSPHVKMNESFGKLGTHLNISEKGLRYMANRAYSLQTGARSLLSIYKAVTDPVRNEITDLADEEMPIPNSYEIPDEVVVKRLERFRPVN